ncbi:unnamed protein product [Sphagnum troendelagicum]|uniref:Uncharacterized protein n=1 Tax=Sphagnum troendelagicum TaxID=128251 RepID=A0ABP0V0Q5_9BRYO
MNKATTTAIAFFFMLWSCCNVTAQLHDAELLQRCNAAPCCGATTVLQRSSVMRSSCSVAPCCRIAAL